ncbi:MAG: methyl-accepting chemotaxis protein [Methylomonas sp.]|nr:methyl-accepting chemotaxis protein [Methylomonas sp.]
MDAIATSARQSAADAELDGWRKAEEIAQATAGLVTQANTIIATFLLVGCAIAIGLVVTIPTGIIRPIKRLSAFAKAFGQGDLTERAQLATRDEIGSMAGDFDQAANNIQGIVSNVRQHAENLHVNAVQLLQSVEATVEGNQTQQTYIEQVATAMEQMAVAVREVADNALMAANAAAEMDVQSKTGLDTVQQAVDAIHALSAEIATAGDTVSDLESHVNNISGILDVIRSVSEQTNLLALNAAIEAARAGEHGRGFAVVADEVRTLASLTQSSTSDIQGMIEKLQTGSKKAVAAMDASRTLSQQSVDKALASGEILNAINVAVSGVNSMNAQIAASAEQQNLVTQDVNRNAIKITEIAETNVVRANASLRSSEALGYIASDLQVAMSRFKV